MLAPSTKATIGPGWPDVLISTGVPRGGLARSALFHLALIGGLFAISKLQQNQIAIVDPRLGHQTITYYRVADELPGVQADPEPASAEESHPADPLPAKQAVMSLPPAPENFRQRIVAPGSATLHAEQRLPNIVAWNSTVPAPPDAGGHRLGADLNLGRSVVAPAPEEIDHALGIMSIEVRAPAPPPAADVPATTALDLPVRAAAAPMAADPGRDLANSGFRTMERTAVAPRPADWADGSAVGLGIPQRAAIAPAAADVHAGAHGLQLPQRAVVPAAAQDAGGGFSSAAGNLDQTARSVLPPSPGSAGKESSAPRLGAGQLVVVGLDPAKPAGPIEVPAGSLHGAFAASPEGKPGATGAPATIAGGNGAGGPAVHEPAASTFSGITIAGASSTSPVPVVSATSSTPPAVKRVPPPVASALTPVRRTTVATWRAPPVRRGQRAIAKPAPWPRGPIPWRRTCRM
ncbi:MAG: hypothetical protein JO041_08385 [Acidobacteria bacterium]|nr:hypothetical protein [Acidobacteriota bacterium]